MKIILVKDVPNLGKKGTEVEVKKGYAKNYLLNFDFAIPCNRKNLMWLKQQEAILLSKKEIIQAHAQEAIEKLNGITLTFTGKMNKEKLYGSVTTTDVINKIKKDYKVKLLETNLKLEPATLKKAGLYKAKVVFDDNLSTSLTVEIKAE